MWRPPHSAREQELVVLQTGALGPCQNGVGAACRLRVRHPALIRFTRVLPSYTAILGRPDWRRSPLSSGRCHSPIPYKPHYGIAQERNPGADGREAVKTAFSMCALPKGCAANPAVCREPYRGFESHSGLVLYQRLAGGVRSLERTRLLQISLLNRENTGNFRESSPDRAATLRLNP